MFLSDLSLRRPVLATVISLILTLVGVVGLTQLPVREYPDIDTPVVSVNTVYEGADPETIEKTIIEPLEEELSGIEAVRTLSSEAKEGSGTVTVEFELSRDIDLASQDVRDRVARAKKELPDDAEDPIVTKEDADAQPIFWLALYGNDYTPVQITDYADRYIKDRLQSIDGVSKVVIGGARERAMRIWLDPVKMAARQVTTLDVSNALRAENIELPSGRLENDDRELSVRTEGSFETSEQFAAMPVKTTNSGATVYLRDVARVEEGPRNFRTLARYNGKNTIGLGIVRQSKANTLEVVDNVKAVYEKLKTSLPTGLNMDIAYDSSTFIRNSLNDVVTTLFQALGLVVLVIWLFLGRLRLTLIPAVTIPVSLIATFGILQAMGFTINTFTLLALILAIGLVVDDAIVVLENVFRHIEMGKTPLNAAIDGTREVGFAVIATTVSLVAVFFPLAYMEGTVGRLFSEFSFSVAGAVIISTILALTIVPVLCSKLLKSKDEWSDERANPIAETAHRFYNVFNRVLDGLRDGYARSLDWALSRTKTMLAVAVAVILLTLAANLFIKREFLPTEDRSTIFSVAETPQGSTLDYTMKAIRQAEAIYFQQPEVERVFAAIAFGGGAPNSAFMFIHTIPPAERTRKQQEIVQSIFPSLLSIPEGNVFAFNPPSGPLSSFGQNFQIVLQGFNLEQLNQVNQQLFDAIKENEKLKGLIQLDSDLKLNKPELEVNINREEASQLGISARSITNTLQFTLGGFDVSEYTVDGKRYDVVLQLEDEARKTPNVLNTIQLRSDSGELTPLSSVIDWKEQAAPTSLNHYSRLRSSTIKATTLPFLSLGDAIDEVETVINDILPAGMSYEWAGASRELLDTANTIQIAFLLAVLFVFLVLAAQFESFVHPFVVMLTVPLAVCGALITLFLFGNSMNVYSQIGMILLVGLVTKNGILIVEYANTLFNANPSAGIRAAVFEACRLRFRPILMTAFSTVFGILPLALGLGAGGESRQSLGLAIVGGMVLATALTLFIVPLFYRLMNEKRLAKKALS